MEEWGRRWWSGEEVMKEMGRCGGGEGEEVMEERGCGGEGGCGGGEGEDMVERGRR